MSFRRPIEPYVMDEISELRRSRGARDLLQRQDGFRRDSLG